MEKVITWKEIYRRVARLPHGKCWGIPRGGQIVAGLTGNAVDSIDKADYIVDDIIDSGKTLEKYLDKEKPVHVLFDKRKEFKNTWLTLPWENTQQDIEDTIIRQLEYIGENTKREGLKDTPMRVIRSWQKLYGGYGMDLTNVTTKFSKENYNEMVIAKDITFFSTCEHHILPFFGKIHIAYICRKKLAGLSKLSRIVEMYSRRLQIQERMTDQIADAINKLLKPKGVGVIVEAQHLCVMARGVEQPSKKMITSSLRGNFHEQKVKNEFLQFIK